MDRFGPEGLERAGFNSWAMAEGQAEEDTVERIGPKEARQLGMSKTEFKNRLPE